MDLAFQPLLSTVRPQPSQLRCWGRAEAAFPSEGTAIYLPSVGSVLFSKQSCCPPASLSYTWQAEAKSKEEEVQCLPARICDERDRLGKPRQFNSQKRN